MISTYSNEGRRAFLKGTALAATSTYLAPWPAWAQQSESKPLRIGVIADIHKDVMHDADDRLSAFIDHMKREAVDFIIQLGDFCVPIEENKGFLDIWNTFPQERYHVLGNHDTDGGSPGTIMRTRNKARSTTQRLHGIE